MIEQRPGRINTVAAKLDELVAELVTSDLNAVRAGKP